MGHRTNPNGITEWRGSSYGTTKKQLTEKGNMAQSCQNGFFDSGVIPEKYEPRIVPMGMENDNPGILTQGCMPFSRRQFASIRNSLNVGFDGNV
jgi:hypothetical protein